MRGIYFLIRWLAVLYPVGMATAKVTVTANAPKFGVISSSTKGTISTRLFDEKENSNHARGQLFTLGDGAGTRYSISSISIQKRNPQAFKNDTLVLRIFKGSQTQWLKGAGHSMGVHKNDYFARTTVTPLYEETFTLNGTIRNGHWINLFLSTPLVVDEDSDFGFLLTYHQVDGKNGSLEHYEGGRGGRISVSKDSHDFTALRRVNFVVRGSATIPEPSTAILVVLPIVGLIRRRRC